MTDLRELLRRHAIAPSRELDVSALMARAHHRQLRARLAAWLAAVVAIGAIAVPVGESLVPGSSHSQAVRTVNRHLPTPSTVSGNQTVSTLPTADASHAASRPSARTAAGHGPGVVVSQAGQAGHATPTPGRVAYTGTDGKIYVRSADGSRAAIANGFDPRWSPDGTRLVYWTGTGNAAECENDPYPPSTGECSAQVWIVNADGSSPHMIASPGIEPDWSPDGRQVVYVVGGPQVSDSTMWIADANGSHARQVTHVKGQSDHHPRWSPDGSAIAFERCCGSDSTTSTVSIFVIHPDGTGLTHLFGDNSLSTWSPAWSPDGTRIAYTGYDYFANKINIYVDNSHGPELAIAVTHDRAGSTYVENMDYAPAWSPDGQHLAYTHDPDGADGFNGCDVGPTTGCAVGGTAPGTIYEVSPDGSNAHAIATGSFPAYAPS